MGNLSQLLRTVAHFLQTFSIRNRVEIRKSTAINTEMNCCLRKKRKEFVHELREHIKWMDMPPTISNGYHSRFAREFQHLRKEDKRNTDRRRFRTSGAPQNRSRNRYENILCDERTRVKLKDSSLDQNDYINANRISGQCGHPGYIATQAPIKETIHHFWQMVFESRARTIVMLTTESERRTNGQRKCEKYWPSLHRSATYGNIRIENVLEETRSGHSVVGRHFRITHLGRRGCCCRNTTRHVVQLQVADWPDASVPRNTTGLFRVLKEADRLSRSKSTPGGPVVVHCSAGVGRTGTFIAIDQTYRWLLKAYTPSSRPASFRLQDFLETVRGLKSERANMVQTTEQYRFMHLVVLEMFSRY